MSLAKPQTEEILSKLEEAFRIDANIEQACAFAGISYSLYYTWMDNEKLPDGTHDGPFYKRMFSAQQYPFLLSKSKVMQAITKDDARLAMDWLTRREKSRYSTRTEVTGEDGKAIEFSLSKHAASIASRYTDDVCTPNGIETLVALPNPTEPNLSE